MKALIFNSGIGKRMKELTANSPKSMVKLLNGETIFERQIRILSECGIKDFIITTGPFPEQLKVVTEKKAYEDLNFTFVQNDLYDKTNYIYSCYLAKDYLDDDFLTLHGDLVFSKKLVQELLKNSHKSIGLINKNIPLPEKDFKARIKNEKIVEVGINIFDDNCFAFQPLYKLSKQDIKTWVDAIVDFINNNNTNVYAENAFNTISEKMNLFPMSYEQYYINEIDNIEDYSKVSKDIQLIDYQDQKIITGIENLKDELSNYGIKRPLFVIDKFLINSWIMEYIDKENAAFFSDFNPNPLYEDVINGIKEFKNNYCDGIVSIGGGSAIDVAKAIKLFLPLDETSNYLNQVPIYHNLKHIAIPTTAGTGSESTRYSVIYYNNTKQSLTSDMLIPDTAILDERFLESLPLNQKVSTLFDALSHCIESFWSINSTEISKKYSIEALKIIKTNIDNYINNNQNSLEILKAANLAGKAINISQTTAAHALSYKVTSLYRIPHGKSVAMILPFVWEKLTNLDIYGELKKHITIEEYKKYLSLYCKNDKIAITKDELNILVNSVNETRLKNYPIQLTKEDIADIYMNAFFK